MASVLTAAFVEGTERSIPVQRDGLGAATSSSVPPLPRLASSHHVAVRRHAIVVHLVAAQTARVTDRPRPVGTGWFGLVEDLVGGHPPTHSPDERRISESTRSCTSRPRSVQRPRMAHCVPLPSPWIPARRSLVSPSGLPTLIHRKSSWMGRVCPKYSSPRRLSPGTPRGRRRTRERSTRPAAPPLPLKTLACLVTVFLGSFGAQVPANRHVPTKRDRRAPAPTPSMRPVCQGLAASMDSQRQQTA